jgi:hypothetical protein
VLSTTSRLRCGHCAEVTGVYEPMIVVASDKARETSRAAEPSVVPGPRERYPRAYYFERLRSAAA